jgi:hypothetical protein
MMARSENGTEPAAWEKGRKTRSPGLAGELLLVFAAMLLGGLAAWPVLRFHEEKLPPDLASYFSLFNPSAMIGTGHGFVVGSEERLPALRAFLNGDRPDLVLPDVEASEVSGPQGDTFVMSHYYLVRALGGWWRMTGVSMHSFMLFACLLYSVTAAFLYAFFRLGCGRSLSLAGVCCVVTSPLWLQMAPSLRDFAKAPFVTGFLLLAAWAAVRRPTGRGLLVWAVFAGLLLGFGWGFRQDLLACFPPALLLPWVVRLDSRGGWRWRAAASAAVLSIIVCAGWPVISAMRGNSGAVSAHTLMQGFSERSETAMSFGDASHVQYGDWGDPPAHGAAAAYAARRGGLGPMGGFHSPGYVAAARGYIGDTLRLFPADFFRRGLASACSLPALSSEACRSALAAPVPGAAPLAPWLARWASAHRLVDDHLASFGLAYALLALAVGFAVNPRAAAILAVLGVYIGAYPSLLFQPRHAFHLSFVPYWAAAWLAAMVWRGAARLKGGPPEDGASWRRSVVRALAGTAAFLTVLAGTGWCLDWCQQRRVDQMLGRYRSLVLEPVPYRETPRHDGWVLLEPLLPVPGLAPDAGVPPFEATQALLALKLDWAPPVFPLRMVYGGGSTADFSRNIYPLVSDPSSKTPVSCFLPAVELNWPAPTSAAGDGAAGASQGRFLGVAVPEPQLGLVRGLFRVTDASAAPLQLFVTVPDEPSRFVAGKTGPWTKRLEVARALWRGTPDERAAALCGLAQRYPYDTRVRGALEDFLKNCNDPAVWGRGWPVLQALNPDVPPAEACGREAAARLSAGDTAGAVALWRRARVLAPGDLRNRVALGGALEAAGDDAAALDEYRAVVGEAPESPKSSARMDAILEKRGDKAARVEEWGRLAARHPDAAVPQLHLGLALEAAGDAAGAEAAYRRMLTLDKTLVADSAILDRIRREDSWKP